MSILRTHGKLSTTGKAIKEKQALNIQEKNKIVGIHKKGDKIEDRKSKIGQIEIDY